jgi:hypothetical protein
MRNWPSIFKLMEKGLGGQCPRMQVYLLVQKNVVMGCELVSFEIECNVTLSMLLTFSWDLFSFYFVILKGY